MSDTQERLETDQRRVRPRQVWGGTGAAIVGMCAIGLGMVLDTAVVWVAGILVTLAGLAVGWRGGLLYDVHGGSLLKHAKDDVLSDNIHLGTSPQSQIVAAGPREKSAELDRRRRILLRTTTSAPYPPLAPIGIVWLLVLATWLLVGEWVLGYPVSVDGQNASLRDSGVAIVVGLCAIWLRQVGPSRVATGLCVLCAVLLIVFGLVLPHDAARVQWNEIVVGVLVLVASCTTLRS